MSVWRVTHSWCLVRIRCSRRCASSMSIRRPSMYACSMTVPYSSGLPVVMSSVASRPDLERAHAVVDAEELRRVQRHCAERLVGRHAERDGGPGLVRQPVCVLRRGRAGDSHAHAGAVQLAGQRVGCVVRLPRAAGRRQHGCHQHGDVAAPAAARRSRRRARPAAPCSAPPRRPTSRRPGSGAARWPGSPPARVRPAPVSMASRRTSVGCRSGAAARAERYARASAMKSVSWRIRSLYCVSGERPPRCASGGPPPNPANAGAGDGQFTMRPTPGRSVISSHVQPSSIMAAAIPAMRPPVGDDTVTSTPLERATPRCRVSGLNATCALRIGVEVTELVDVDGHVQATDLEQAHVAPPVDEARVDVAAGDIHALGVLRHGHVAAHGRDAAAIKDDGAALDDAAGDGVDGAAHQRHGTLLPRRGLLRVQCWSPAVARSTVSR
jgi:hypothetical protein